jgi:predicted SnoaL-like aldol condensation-catalyzing enzyme
VKRLLLTLAFALACAPLAATAQVPVTPAADQQALLKSRDAKLAANKKLVFDMWREVLQAGDVDKADVYMDVNYIQHNPLAATGREAFKKFFAGRPKREVKPTIDNLVSVVAEGDLVVLSFVRSLPEPADPTKRYTSTWFDMFRIENGKIAEHWDIATKTAGPPRPPAAPASPATPSR